MKLKRNDPFKTHKNKMVRPDDGRRSLACRRRRWIAEVAEQDMGANGEVTRGEYTLLNMAAELAVPEKAGEKISTNHRQEIREIIGTLRRGRGKRA